MIQMSLKRPPFSAGYAFANSVVSRMMLVVITMLAASYLLEADFAVFAIIMSSVSSIASLSAMGIGIVANTTAAKFYDDEPNFVSSVYTSVIGVCLVLSIGFTLAFLPPLLALDSRISPTVIFVLLSTISLLMTISSASEGVAYGLKRTGTMLIISLIVLIFTSSFALPLMKSHGLIGAVISLLIFRFMQTTLLACTIFYSSKVRFSPRRAISDWRRVKPIMFRMSLPIALASALAAPVTTLALLILERKSGAGAVAMFAIAQQIFMLLVFPPTAMGAFLISNLSSKGANIRGIARKSVKYLFIYGLIGLCASVSSALILPLINDKFAVDFAVMSLIGIAVLFYSLSIGFNCLWSSLGVARYLLWGQIGWSTMVLASTFLGGSDFGALSLAAGFALGAFVQLLIHVLIFLKTANQND